MTLGPFLLDTKFIRRERKRLIAQGTLTNLKKRFSVFMNLARQQQIKRVIAQGFSIGKLHDRQPDVEMLKDAFFAFTVVTVAEHANGLAGFADPKVFQRSMGIRGHFKLRRVRSGWDRHNRFLVALHAMDENDAVPFSL